MQAGTKSLGDQVDGYFTQGYCCSESIVMAVVDEYCPEVSPELAMAASSGLCGGMGSKQATCGVFTGGAIALGLVLGKGQKKDKKIKQLSAQYFEKMELYAGAQQCQQVLKKMGLKNWNRSRCRLLTCRGGIELQALLEGNR